MASATGSRAEFAHYWKMSVCRGGCVMCEAFPVGDELYGIRRALLCVVEAHHVIPKHILVDERLMVRKSRAIASLSVEYDERNGVGLCTYHHGRHTDWVQRMPRSLVPEETFEFADEHGILHRLDREYPA